ncbi:MAG: tyrosine-type recombinase/integrase [Paraclostridium sp.]|uniref:tyrosine-type recombinase/integrase n=1 Tax=Paraclostridium sp. TaxID=2023273 RepID=UPI003F33B7FF
MEQKDIFKILTTEFLNTEEKFKILTDRGVKIDKNLINLILDFEMDLDFQIELVKEIKERNNFETQNSVKIESEKNISIYNKKSIKSISKPKQNKSRDDIDKELNESKATRPLTQEEFNKIISLLQFGAKYTDRRGSKRRIEPNKQVALILSVQATIGFRINDILRMKLRDIRGSKISFIEQKTKKLQYRKVNIEFIEALQDYADDLNLSLDDYLFNMTARNIQKILKKATDYLGYNYIGTHSFRKFYAVNAYKASNNNLELVRSLLNHSSVAITQRYINVDQEKIDEYSSSVNLVRKSLVD